MPRSTEQPGSLARDKAVRKYLDRHAEPEADFARCLLDQKSPHAAILVIPAYGEDASLFRALESVPPCGVGRALIIVVVNERMDAPEWAKAANANAIERLHARVLQAPGARDLGPGIRAGANATQDFVLIDRTGPRALPPRQGVGLARKIGADFALALIANGSSRSSWIHCSDADVRLPRDYFERSAERSDGAALLYDFLHETDDDARAILEYEIYLRYHVLGLRSAGSPYAFQAIGSTLALDARAYAQVRGFPRREAAEDFHLLAKLAKVGDLHALRGEPILLSGRTSSRVPFGTGRAMLRARERAGGGAHFPAPDPRNYLWLAAWLAALQEFARQPRRPLQHAIERAARDRGLDPLRLVGLLDQLGAIESAQERVPKRGDLARSLNENFDALATLRLLHALRDEVHPDVSLEHAIAQAPFLADAVAGIARDDLDAVRAALINFEQHPIR